MSSLWRTISSLTSPNAEVVMNLQVLATLDDVGVDERVDIYRARPVLELIIDTVEQVADANIASRSELLCRGDERLLQANSWHHSWYHALSLAQAGLADESSRARCHSDVGNFENLQFAVASCTRTCACYH